MSNESVYDVDYFLHGKRSGKSLYEDYRWLPELTIPMAKAIIAHCGIYDDQTVLDFGCARGYLVKALRLCGREAYGHDVSQWALDNCDEVVRPYVNLRADMSPFWQHRRFDWIIAKDVLEHIEYAGYVIKDLMDRCDGMFVVVPLAPFDGQRYVIEEYEKDVTHVQRLTLLTWVKFFLRHDWRVECAYRVPGVKDNYYRPGWEYGNGFITARRIRE